MLCYNRSAFPNPERRVPDFFAFAGLRYDCAAAGTDLEMLAAPPYDVIDEDRRAALEAADAHNAVRLLLPRDRHTDGDRYRQAADALAAWQQSGVLVTDLSPRLYPYRMQFRGPHGVARHTRGVIGALALPGPGDASVLPHERTAAKAKSDRLALLRATRANVDPIWGLSLAAGLTDLLEPDTRLAACVDADGVIHELGAIDDPARIAQIGARIGSASVVLADGHHRYETACAYRDEVRDHGDVVPGADAIMMFVVELIDDELDIEPIHRLVDLPAGTDLRAALADAFDVVDVGSYSADAVDGFLVRMADEHGLGIVDQLGLAIARPRPEVRARALADEHPAVAATDAAVVEAMVVPRLVDATWRYWHDAAVVAAQVDKG
ncbi:MAG TPA: DUF1015 domain-containing protein, partial [Acidimicrobiia bacterium]|nr:DUF1015 domain-containing protein [Acidimicrobiia bacterium]